ncbi:hypothetical protein ACOME3_003641 [Neoechinorhynchus agilis]
MRSNVESERSDFQCALLSFCPDPCCGRQLANHVAELKIALFDLVSKKDTDAASLSKDGLLGAYDAITNRLIFKKLLTDIYTSDIDLKTGVLGTTFSPVVYNSRCLANLAPHLMNTSS